MIREYQDTDKAQVLCAWVEASRVAHPFMDEAFLSEMQVKIAEIYLPNTQTFVAEVNGKVEGFIALMGNEIGGLFLNPNMHGKGLGRQLLDKAKSLHSSIVLDVFEKNTIGRAFYMKAGFLQIDEGIFAPLNEKTLRLEWKQI